MSFVFTLFLSYDNSVIVFYFLGGIIYESCLCHYRRLRRNGKSNGRVSRKKRYRPLADVNEERLVQAKEELETKGMTDVHYQVVDITDAENVRNLAEKAASLGP